MYVYKYTYKYAIIKALRITQPISWYTSHKEETKSSPFISPFPIYCQDLFHIVRTTFKVDIKWLSLPIMTKSG